MIKPQERERKKKQKTPHCSKGLQAQLFVSLLQYLTSEEMVGRLLKGKKPNKSAEALFQDIHTVMLKLYHAYLKIHPLRSELSSTSPSPPPKRMNSFLRKLILL